MKFIYTIVVGSLLLCSTATRAQESDTAVAARNALRFADSLIRANFYQDWKTYMDLTCPSAIKYYGSREQFKENVVGIYFRNEPQREEKPETARILEMRNEIDQWQCVIEKVRNTFISDKKAVIYSSLIGQSLDGGVTWKFIDVSHNSMQNVAFVLPTVFSDMTIPLAKTIYPDEVVAQVVEEPAPKTTTKKKSAPKKR